MNTDQGGQFTGSDWLTARPDAGGRVSMDGRGRCMNNTFIERLWRSLKYQAVCLKYISESFAAQCIIDDWINVHKREGPHAAHGTAMPDEAYAEEIEPKGSLIDDPDTP